MDAAGGHVLGVAVKQASNGTPCNHSKGGARVTSANPGNALVGHRVIGTVPCNLGGEAGKFGRHSCTCLSLAVGQLHSTTEMTKGWREGRRRDGEIRDKGGFREIGRMSEDRILRGCMERNQ